MGKEDSEMLKDNSQLKLSVSPYQGIYDAIIPANHLLRKMKENIDFSFVNPMLRKQYCENFGRPAKEPEISVQRMTKMHGLCTRRQQAHFTDIKTTWQ